MQLETSFIYLPIGTPPLAPQYRKCYERHACTGSDGSTDGTCLMWLGEESPRRTVLRMKGSLTGGEEKKGIPGQEVSFAKTRG